MSQTTNYGFSKPEATTKLTVLVNYNGNLDLIDSTIKTVSDAATTASSTATAAQSTATAAQSAADAAQSTATAAGTAAAAAASAATAAQSTADAKAAIDDTAAAATTTYSSEKIETELNTKQDEITGAATTIVDSNLTTNRALISNSTGKVEASSITSTQLGYLSGVTSNIQSQINTIKAYSSTTVSAVNGHSDYAVLYKAGHVVTFDYEWDGSLAGVTAFTLPANYRPVSRVLIVPVSTNQKGQIEMHIETNGKVSFVGGNGQTEAMYGTATYIVAN